MSEEWRVVARNPSYAVSSLGRVKRITDSRTHRATGKCLALSLRAGYPFVQLCSDGKRTSTNVHDLVAEAFLGTRPEGAVVNHRDADKTNNRPENLEYVTQSRNVKHAYGAGLRDCRGSGNGQAKLTRESVLEIRTQLEGGRHHAAVAADFGVSEATVRAIRDRRSWRHV